LFKHHARPVENAPRLLSLDRLFILLRRTEKGESRVQQLFISIMFESIRCFNKLQVTPSRIITALFSTVALVAVASASNIVAQAPSNLNLPAPHAFARVRVALLAALSGDALALGGHYEYDARVLVTKCGGPCSDFFAPGSNYGVGWGRANYHPGKVAGDLTDAGDVVLMTLEHVATLATRGTPYNFDGFEAHWRTEITERGYGSCNFQSVGRDAVGCPPGLRPGYLNGGTRMTLEAVFAAMQHNGGVMPVGEARKALAANVNCLAAATHFLPLFLIESDEATLVANAVSTVYLSHGNRDPVAAAAFLARALYRLIHRGDSLLHALQGAADAVGDAFISTCLANAIAKVQEVEAVGSQLGALGAPFTDDAACTSMARLWDVGRSEPIKVGKASPTEGALPSALYFSLRYTHSLEAALVANANVGGDSAARGVVIGMLLGAAHGDRQVEDVIPSRWLTQLRSRERVEELLQQVQSATVDANTAQPSADFKSEL
jgi:hypothetical protein